MPVFTGQEHILDFLLLGCISSNSEDSSRCCSDSGSHERLNKKLVMVDWQWSLFLSFFFTLQWSNTDTNFSKAHRLVCLNFKGGGRAILPFC